MKYIYALLIVVLLIGGCAPVMNPVKTLTAIKETGNDNSGQTPATGTTTSPALKECKEAIDYKVLIAALPTSAAGYTGDEPQGNTLTFQNPSDQTTIKYSMASVTLTKDEKNIDVSATDTCYVQFLSAAWLGFYESEGTSGYLKKVTIAGYPGWHQYEKSGETYSYNVFVADRVIVTVQGSNGVADSDVKAAIDAVGFSAIAAAAK